ncbi:heme-binding domain-containing protein [Chryseobacterium arthrosphaerae]|uniref:heme-binding domain-containing protein n=1 Tax=Chryseobacterium arthrosphaerae TaxID=651561 RepID=UPI0023E29C67|nr:heme-binding domain-containing protein [Chryseobacterium arthrosphaerae]WES98736.1 heme-binding domain-containing protein [Chryseobacterium arthrosphaerae]
MKQVKRIRLIPITFLCIVAGFISLQFFNPPIEQKPVTGHLRNVPRQVEQILEQSCYNCHSNQQQLSFFDKIAPVSWIVNKDIARAREVMNFSEWDKLTDAEQKGKFYAIYNMVNAGKMPLPSYALTHPGAKLTAGEIGIIKQYAISLSAKDNFIPAQQTVDLPKENRLVQTSGAVPVSPNGIEYNTEFRNWKVIGMSTLIDNTIRVIYGNDIAVKAIEQENFHPWPDGSAVAKAVFKQTKKSNGDIAPGDFVNMQYMVKDGKEFTNTEGWGFAKFNGPELKPTGKTALFAQQSCISCHRQLAESTGFLFNVPPKVNSKKLIEQYLKTVQK